MRDKMKRRYNGWREIRNTTRNDRKKIIAYTVRILPLVLIPIIVILVICGFVFIKDLAKTEESSEVVNLVSVPDMVIEPEITPTPEPPVEEDKVILVLDAGHGGKDGGTYNGDILEKDINLAVVLYIKEALEEEDIEIILTRSTDEFLDVPDRSNLANAEEADIFVSIHCNYFEDDAGVSGLECYYHEENNGGQAFAESMIEVLKGNKDIKVRSAKHGNYYVLKHTDMPSILIEMGFLSNKAECEKLNSTEYQKLLAGEIAEGILLNLPDEPEDVNE